MHSRRVYVHTNWLERTEGSRSRRTWEVTDVDRCCGGWVRPPLPVKSTPSPGAETDSDRLSSEGRRWRGKGRTALKRATAGWDLIIAGGEG